MHVHVQLYHIQRITEHDKKVAIRLIWFPQSVRSVKRFYDHDSLLRFFGIQSKTNSSEEAEFFPFSYERSEQQLQPAQRPQFATCVNSFIRARRHPTIMQGSVERSVSSRPATMSRRERKHAACFPSAT